MKPFSRTRLTKRVPIVLGFLALSISLSVATSQAHSFVRSTDPKDDSKLRKRPSVVVIRFNEPVEIAFGGIQVFDPAGERVDRGKTEFESRDRKVVRTRLAEELANGRYIVRWRIVAADGHPRKGQFDFRLSQPPPPASPSPAPGAEEPGMEEEGAGTGAPDEEGMGGSLVVNVLFGITRWIIFASLLLLIGLGAFAIVIWRRTGGPSRSREVNKTFYHRSSVVIRAALVGAIVGTVASLPLQGAIAGDVPLARAFSGDILKAVLDTRFGEVVLVRLALLAVFAAGLLTWRSVAKKRVVALAPARQSVGAMAVRPAPPRLTEAMLALVALAMIGTISFAGHAGTTEPVPLNMTADVLHLVAAAVWLGGLVGLVGVALPATRSLEDGPRVQVAAPVVSRFSDLATIAVAVMALTGVLRAWIEIRTLEGLTGYAYGLTLLGKLAVVVPLLALGGINRQWTKPRLRRMAAGETIPGSGSPLRTLRRLVLVEVILAAAVLAITAALVELPPPASEGDHV